MYLDTNVFWKLYGESITLSKSRPPISPKCCSKGYSATVATTRHRRLGRSNARVLRGAINGKSLGINSHGKSEECPTFLVNKSTERLHPKIPNNHEEQAALELTVMGTIGPISQTSIDRFSHLDKFSC